MANIDEVASGPGKLARKRRRLQRYLEHEDPAIRAHAEEALRPPSFDDDLADVDEWADPVPGTVRVVVEVAEEELDDLWAAADLSGQPFAEWARDSWLRRARAVLDDR